MSDYSNSLKQEGRNLSKLVKKGQLPLPQFRDTEIDNALAAIRRGRSILVIGEPGVGKTCVIHGLAKALAHEKRHLWEISTTVVLTGTKWLGEWQTKLQAILDALENKNALLYITDIWNMQTVGASSNDPSAMLDYLKPKLQSGKLQLVGELSVSKLEELKRVPEFSSLFEQIRIEPLRSSQIRQIIETNAANRASLKPPQQQTFEFNCESIDTLMALCGRYLANDQGPGQALRLLDQVIDYHKEKCDIKEPEDISPAFVEKVFSIYSGLPLFVISQATTIPAKEIRRWFQERVIGQEQAIEAVLEVITLFKAGLHDTNKPIGSFLFVGPTGVGKTELAKALAKFLFGSESRLLRFDLSEFKDYHAYQMLIGNPDNPKAPARLLDPVRSNPFQIVLFDEIEKAHANIWDSLLQLLDEGHVSPPNGRTVNFRNTIVIATSNVGAQEAQRNPFGFTATATQQIPIKTLETVFRPELLNRFQHIVAFNGLSKDNVKLIVEKEIKQVISREGIVSRNLAIEVNEDVIDTLIEHGYDADYGARALKRQVQQRIVLPIANYLMETEVFPGSILKLDSPQGVTKVRSLETATSRVNKKEKQQQILAKSKGYSRKAIDTSVQKLSNKLSELCSACNETHLLETLQELDTARTAQNFWQDPQNANTILLKTDDIKNRLRRLDGLKSLLESIKEELTPSVSTNHLEILARRLDELDALITSTKRELVTLGNDGNWDIIVAITPLSETIQLRNQLYETYRNWTKWRRFTCQLLLDPISNSDPIFFLIKGPYAFGYLQGEYGVQRARYGEQHEAVRITVAPCSQPLSNPKFANQYALKKKGLYGDKIRSRVEVETSPRLILQNNLNIVENRELARELTASWQQCLTSDDVIRRFDFEPFLLKDYLTDTTIGRQSILKPKEFHQLLEQRVDLAN